MFFSSKIVSIKPTDRVLEIGPGSTPHSRSDAFLDLRFDTERDKISHRGGVLKDPKFGNRPIHFFDGAEFPFEDNQFDYVICSHVVEHVLDPEFFMREIFRTGSGRGYLEYPLITYEYLYDFDVHRHFVKFDSENRVLRYLPKDDTALREFSPVCRMLRTTLERGWGDLCAAHENLFFEGFEFDSPFTISKEARIENLLPSNAAVRRKHFLRRAISYVENKIGL